MQELVFLQSITQEPYTTDKVIADHSDNSLKAVRNLIRDKKERLEKYEVLHFENAKPRKGSKGGRPEKIYHLNERQATLLITFLDNTPTVEEFKTALVDEFFKMRDELTKRKINRIEEKPLRKTLTDAVKEWEHRTDWSYNHISNLLYKAVTGMNAKQLKKARNPKAKASLDVLTSEEQEQYKQLETRVIGYLLAQMTFGQIKAMLNGGTLQVTEWREVK
ncbi:Rha family transcriptional regulator [Ligilactobacillus animalis]|uniref:Rha family transcriptional regulator n=1 Tax=Ligilactobacillus animalis TaxID=1605 RepID=UPI00384A9FB4